MAFRRSNQDMLIYKEKKYVKIQNTVFSFFTNNTEGILGTHIQETTCLVTQPSFQKTTWESYINTSCGSHLICFVRLVPHYHFMDS